MYAFGGGCASTFWTMKVKGDVSDIAKKMDLLKRLESMDVVSCEEYTKSLQVCPSFHHFSTLYSFPLPYIFGCTSWWSYPFFVVTF